MIKNIIFDWSGTLSDDFTSVYETCMILMEEYGAKRISLGKFKKEFTLPYMNFWHKYFPKLDKKPHDLHYSEVIKNVKHPTIYPGVHDVIRDLGSKGYKMIVISSHPHERLLIEAKEYGIFDFFSDLKGSVHDKVAVIKNIMSHNGFNFENTLYVGDMTHDIEAGKKAGVHTIAITWGYESEKKLKKANPNHIIDDISELKLYL
jgi:phosphoglycolate phosphatase